jgi:Stress responsive A/B Barrel Domain
MTEYSNVAPAIERVILANPRADVSREHLAAVAEAGRDLITAIPGVERISFGVALAADAPYRLYVRIRFRDEQALQTYETHPNHLNFGGQQWLPIIADQIVTDYRIQY